MKFIDIAPGQSVRADAISLVQRTITEGVFQIEIRIPGGSIKVSGKEAEGINELLVKECGLTRVDFAYLPKVKSA